MKRIFFISLELITTYLNSIGLGQVGIILIALIGSYFGAINGPKIKKIHVQLVTSTLPCVVVVKYYLSLKDIENINLTAIVAGLIFISGYCFFNSLRQHFQLEEE